MSFFELTYDMLPALLKGAVVTLELTACSISLGFVLGISLSLGRSYGNRPLSMFCAGYIQLFRGTPLLVQLFILYYGLPRYDIRLS